MSFAAAYDAALRASGAMIDGLAREQRGEACVWQRIPAAKVAEAR